MNITPVPSSRVSDSFVRQQLLEQMQQQQQNLTKLQNEISSGSQLTLPSDNAPAALRAVGLQSLLAQNKQYTTNLTTNSTYLSASDSALSQVDTLLTNVQGIALGATGSTATDAARQAAQSQVKNAMGQIMSLANTVFSGRYLFGGSRTNVQPFALSTGGVAYQGNTASLSSYANTGNLFTTNVTGDSAFGGFSSEMLGGDLSPALTISTTLADLNGGQGVTPGSIQISDGHQTSTVDLSSAANVGDVVKMIEAHPPAGRTVSVQVTATGLAVSLDAAGGGTLSVSDVGGGKTATQLGIAGSLFGSTGPLIGGDLNPALTLTTPLGDLLGAKASASIASGGPNNNVLVQASTNGTAGNGTTVVYLNDAWYQAAPGLAAGNEVATYNQAATVSKASLKLTGPNNDLILTATTAGTTYNNVAVNIVNGGAIGDNATASYDAGAKTLTLTVDGSGQTSTDTLIAAVNSTGVFTAARDASAEPNTSGGFIAPTDIHNGVGNTYLTATAANTLAVHIQSGVSTANDVITAINKTGAFTASLDPGEAGDDGTGALDDSFLDPAAVGTLSGGGGAAFDQASGIQIVNGGQTYTVNFSGSQTVEDLLNKINGAGASVVAEINQAGTGINVQSRLSGSDFSIGENGGQTATQLGIRTFNTNTALSDLNYGQGVQHVAGGDFTIQRRDGVSFTVDISSAKTLGDVLNLINNNATNTAGGVPVHAQLNSFGNGIELVDDDPSIASTLSVSSLGGSPAAAELGLTPINAGTSKPPISGAIASADVVGTGANNDLVFQAKGPGTALNGVTVSFVNTGAPPGAETVTYDSTAHTLKFGVGAATTANTVINVLAADPVAGQLFTASLATTDGGVPNDGSGLVDATATGTLAGGTPDTLSGTDTNPQEVAGIFTALTRLQSALQNNDTDAIQRATGLLTAAQGNLSFVRAQLGASEQSVSSLQSQVQTEQTQLQGALSSNVDVDMATAISDLVAQQTAFQASLQVTGLLSKLTLLNYL
jgi:flagellar hook-associated protein 3 FlgL